MHLDDLLLRRLRIGIQLPRGGLDQVDRIRAIVQAELDWDDNRWEKELARYEDIWQRFYSPKPLGIGEGILP